MGNFLMLLATSGLLFTSMSSTLHDMTVKDCEVFQVQSACSYLEQKNEL